MTHTDRNPASPASEDKELPELIPHEWTQRPFYIRFPLALFGLLLIVLGMLGWLMPIIPGFFLVPIGVVLLAASSRWWADRVNALERRLPLRVRRMIHHSLKRHRPARTTSKPGIAENPAD